MILPVGHEETNLRRVPWVTFGIMILCVVSFVLTLIAAPSGEGSGPRRLEELREYYFAHPYLELDKNLEEHVFEGMGKDRRAAFVEAMKAAAHPPEDPAVIRAEQEELQRLERELPELGDENPWFRWGLVPAHLDPVALVTHMFLHGGWLHLIGNLLILYLCGPYVEDVWGRPLFAALYLVSGVVASLAWVLQHPTSQVPLVGASGAIAGIMGAFLIRYWRTRIKFVYMITFFIRGSFDAPAWLMLPLWFCEQVFLALLSADSESGNGVAYLAHTAGFGFGALAGLAFKSLDIEERFINPRIERKVNKTLVDKPALAEALAARTAGDSARAFGILQAEGGRSPHDRDVSLALWDTALELGRAAEAAPALERVIGQELRTGETDLACTHWQELEKHSQRIQLGAPILLRLSQLLRERNLHDGALRAARRAMIAAGPAAEPGLAIKIAQHARGLDPALVRGAANLALASPVVGPAEREAAERLLREA